MLLIVISFSIRAQELRLLYVDDIVGCNYPADIIVENDGNYLYTASYRYTEEGTVFDIAYIARVSDNGELLNRKFFYPEHGEEVYIENITKINNGEYLVVLTIFEPNDSYLRLLELDKDFNVLHQVEARVSDKPFCAFSKVLKRDDGRYFIAINYSSGGNTIAGDNPVAFTFVMDGNGTISNINSTNDYNRQQINEIIPFNNGESFLLPGNKGCMIYDSDFNFVGLENSNPLKTTFPSSAYCFENDNILCFHAAHSVYEQEYALDIFERNSENKSVVLHRFGLGQVDDGFVCLAPQGRVTDYVNQNNIIFGGTFNAHMRQDAAGMTPYCIYPSKLGIASYNRNTNTISDPLFFEDGIYHYWMMSLSATKDGGGVVIATRADKDQALANINDIVIFKYNRGNNSISESIDNTTFMAYPNPAHNNVILKYGAGCIADFYDSTGRLCKQTRLCSDEESVNIADMKAGMYFIRLTNSDGSMIHEGQKLLIK